MNLIIYEGVKMSITKIVTIVVGFVVIIVLLLLGSSIFEVNKAGFFQVKQAAISGKMSVRQRPGLYGQWFGTIFKYKNVATIGFGEIEGEGLANVGAVPVIFNDGSTAKISALVRVKLPSSKDKILNLKQEFAGGFDHLIKSGLVPIVENVVKLSANLRSAQDAYTTLALFQQAIIDQLTNGIYVTKSDVQIIKRSTGDVEEIKVTVIVLDEQSDPIRLPNRLEELGCSITECTISIPDFDPKVLEMISKRKDEAMKTELAKQAALRAKQDAITAEEQGKADVAKAKAQKLVEKIEAVTNAEKEYEVAQLNRKKADEEAKAELIKRKAEAEANRLLVAAGLTPLQKAEIEKEIAIGVAEKLSGVKFPASMVIVGGNGKSNGADPFTAVGLNQLLELVNKVKKGNTLSK